MCGRYTLTAGARRLRDAFPLYDFIAQRPRYNIAPTQHVLIVRQENAGPRAALVRWGLVPSWAKDKKIASSLINARGDTVSTKPAYRAAFKQRRCLVIADGFYEWPKGQTKGPKQANHFRLADFAPLAFAGLWESWPGEEPALETCSIITTDANDLVRPLHDRMPVILEPREYARWLDPAPKDPAELTEMLRPFPADSMIAAAVGPTVNSARNEGEECLAPPAPTLF